MSVTLGVVWEGVLALMTRLTYRDKPCLSQSLTSDLQQRTEEVTKIQQYHGQVGGT